MKTTQPRRGERGTPGNAGLFDRVARDDATSELTTRTFELDAAVNVRVDLERLPSLPSYPANLPAPEVSEYEDDVTRVLYLQVDGFSMSVWSGSNGEVYDTVMEGSEDYPDHWDAATEEQFEEWAHALELRMAKTRRLLVEAVAESKGYSALLNAVAGLPR